MNDTTGILVLVFGTLLFTLFAIFTIMYVALQKRRQLQHRIEKQDMEHRFASELMKSRIEVQEETMKQISNELHDNIAQVLGLAKMHMHQLAHKSEGSQKKTAESSAEIIGKAIIDVRAMSHTLNGTFVQGEGLKESIEKEVAYIKDAKEINCNFKLSGVPLLLDENTQLMIFRIIQESIGNAVKHGNPQTISILLDNQPNDLTVLVTDDGTGFDTNDPELSKGLGLGNIEERARLLNGTVNITSETNKGTTVQLKIPVSHAS